MLSRPTKVGNQATKTLWEGDTFLSKSATRIDKYADEKA